MIQVHGFTDVNVALRLKEIAGTPPTVGEDQPSGNLVSWLLRSPAGGIAAYTSYNNPTDEGTVPSAWCKAWLLYREGDTIKIRKAYDSEGNELELLVANLLPEAIAANRLGRATSCMGGALLVDWMACG
jgi:hypothetical protein